MQILGAPYRGVGTRVVRRGVMALTCARDAARGLKIWISEGQRSTGRWDTYSRADRRGHYSVKRPLKPENCLGSSAGDPIVATPLFRLAPFST
jgi:hypothetical protein